MKPQRILQVATFFILLFSGVLATAQSSASRSESQSAQAYRKSQVYYPAADCAADLRRLEEVLRDAHPCLYCLADSLALHTAFAQAIAELEADPAANVTENKFLHTVRRLVAMVQDGHLYAESNTSLVNYVSEQGKFFPLSLAIDDGKAYIREDYSATLDSAALGAQLLTINGTPVTTVIAEMMPLLSADANLQKAKWRQLENVFTFDILYWTLYEPTDTYQIIYRTANGSVRSQDVTAVAGSIINLANADNEVTRHLTVDETTSTAYLDINTFYNADSKRDNAAYERFLAQSFREIKQKGVKNLVIDLRDNPGGLVHNAYRLFSYISPTDVESKVMVKSSSFLKQQKKLSFVEIMLKNLSRTSYAARIDRAPFGTLVEVKSKRHFLKSNSLKFTGNTYVLANGATFSAASMLVKLCRDYHVGIIAGEENAACQAVSFGDLVGFDLPHTATKVYVSTSIVTRDDDLEKRSIQPEIALTRHIRNDARGYDSVLQQLLHLVGQAPVAHESPHP
ncbi:MAG: S41 family peptidase [Cytophagales bacterium]|nr:S41 family peptidase [Cytophagales bacterium]